MGTSERKEKEKMIRREDIISAAEKVFFNKSYELSTMDEVAKEAQYSKRTLYIYFQSKEQLLHAILFRAYRTLNEMFKRNLDENKQLNGFSQLKLLGETYLNFMMTHNKYFETIVLYNGYKSELPIEDEFKKASDTEGEVSFNYLIEVLKKATLDQSIRDDIDIKKTAFILYANVIGISNLLINKESYLSEHQIASEELIQELFRFVERSLKK